MIYLSLSTLLQKLKQIECHIQNNGIEFDARRKRLTPVHLEVILFLKFNRNLFHCWKILSRGTASVKREVEFVKSLKQWFFLKKTIAIICFETEAVKIVCFTVFTSINKFANNRQRAMIREVKHCI